MNRRKFIKTAALTAVATQLPLPILKEEVLFQIEPSLDSIELDYQEYMIRVISSAFCIPPSLLKKTESRAVTAMSMLREEWEHDVLPMVDRFQDSKRIDSFHSVGTDSFGFAGVT